MSNGTEQSVIHSSLPNLVAGSPRLEGIQTIHFNGFAIGVGAGDVTITLYSNQERFANLNASYTVAKTLAKALDAAISEFEKATGHTILTMQDVHESLQKPK